MKGLFGWMPVLAAGAVLMLFLSGCTVPRVSETGRTAVEQFLLSSVIERGVGCADFQDLAKRKAFIEYDYLAPQVDKPYVQGFFEMHLANNGVIVTRNQKEADVVIQIICGVLATDTHKFMFGVPALPIPLPTTSLNVAIPEISLFQKMTRSGFGRFAFNILDAKTRTPIRSISGIEVSTSYVNWTILLLPFKSHDMPLQIRKGTKTQFGFDWK